MATPSASELLANVQSVLQSEGSVAESSNKDKLRELILPALESTRNTHSALYGYEPPHASGFVRKLKNFVLSKFRNVTINVLEQQVMKQQKFNELTYQALLEMSQELDRLKNKN